MTNKLSIEGLQVTIGYLYLLSFCIPERIHEFGEAGSLLRKGLALKAGLTEAEYFERVLPEACRRIVAFHQRTRQPESKTIEALTESARQALFGAQQATSFQAQMAQMSASPARAKPDQRLRASKGCQFCAAPCRYGFFALTTKPNYALLKKLLAAEAQKPSGEQDPLQAGWSFATAQLWRALGTEQGYISPFHLGNLAYCLLTLGMAKSRYPLPEGQYQKFQEANQALIQTWPASRPV